MSFTNFEDMTVTRCIIGPFENNWSLSVISGHGCYSNLNEDPPLYEVAVLDQEGKLNYEHTDGDVLAYQTPDDIETLTEKIKALKNGERPNTD